MTQRRFIRAAAVISICMAGGMLAPESGVWPEARAKDLAVETQPPTVHLIDRRLVTAQGAEVNFVSGLIAKQPILL